MIPPDVLDTLDPAALTALADYYRRLADILSSTAAERGRAAVARARLQARKQAVFAAADLLPGLLASGVPYAAAIAQVAAASGLDEAAIDVAWRAAGRRKAMESRTRTMVDMARAGRTNGEIGAAVGLSAAQVGRILRKA